MNEFLAERFVERVTRLVLGIEPVDAQRGSRIAHPVTVAIEGVPYPPTESAPQDEIGVPDPLGALRRIPRHASCRHALLYPPAIASPVTLRIYEGARRFVPRRIRYPLPADIHTSGPPSRVRRPALFPGAAYDVSPTVTGMRGRVTWKQSATNEVPVRWTRVEAAIHGVVVGRAHGDDRGEFLLMLRNEASGPGDLPSPLVAQVTVFGPPAPVAVPPNDPFADLPVEILAGDPDDVSPGEKPLPGYAATASSTRAVQFELGTLLTDQPKFFFSV
jgi:hypothetical protein